MEKVNKYIYETIVLKVVEEKVPEKTTDEKGQAIEIIRTVKKNKPVKIGILRPERKRAKEAEIFFAKRLSFYLKEGLLPHSLVSKRYLNDGGPLSEAEKKLVDSLRETYVTLQQEYFDMKSPLTEEQITRRSVIMSELGAINKTLRDIQSNYAEIFNNTAEAKSKSDLIEWWILNLSYAEFEEGKGYAPIFGNGDFDTRMGEFEKHEQNNDPLVVEIIKKLSYFISFWNTAGGDVAPEDWKSAEQNYNDNVTTYVVEPLPSDEKGFIPTESIPTAPPVDPVPKEPTPTVKVE